MKNMHRCFLLVLVTVGTSTPLIQPSAASPSRLATTYTITRTDDSKQAYLRVAGPSSVPSLTVGLQTDLTNCGSKMTGNYSGHAFHITGHYTGDRLAVTALRNERVGGVLAGREVLNVEWRPLEEKTLVVAMPKATISLTIGDEGEAGGKCWRLWTRDAEGHRETSSGDSTPPQPNTAGTKAGRGVLMCTYFADSIWGLYVDTLVQDERQHLLNLTFTALQEGRWQMSLLEVPVLSVALAWESMFREGQGKQHWQVEGEVKSTESGASLKLTHLKQDKQDRETQVTNDNGEAHDRCEFGKCGHNGVKELHEESLRHINTECSSDFGKTLKTGVNDACSGRGHKPIEDLKGWSRYEKDDLDSAKVNLVEEVPEEAAGLGLRESVSSDVIEDIRQKITSRIFNISSNMTTFVSPNGGRSIQILQRSHVAFCPRLSWNLNQIFRFSRDWSGWEYVVSTWEWGNMVVRGEWGASLLQWYQKTFTFSLDQAAALPSTQLVLDFRDWRSFKVWLKWPALASALAVSLTLGDARDTLIVEEVDEFIGEGAAVVTARVVVQYTPAGLSLSCYANTSRVQELHASVTALLAQVTTLPEVCGEVPDHATVERFLRDLLGRSPASLWADLLQEGRRLLLRTGSKSNLDYLWEIFEEEMGTVGGAAGLWKQVWKLLERAGLVKHRGEELEVLLPWEWMGVAQNWWTLVVKDGGGRCEGSTLVVRLLEVLAETLWRGGHSQTAS